MILGLAAIGLGLHFKKPWLVWVGGAWGVLSIASTVYVLTREPTK